jgi:hypothetical protein
MPSLFLFEIEHPVLENGMASCDTKEEQSRQKSGEYALKRECPVFNNEFND